MKNNETRLVIEIDKKLKRDFRHKCFENDSDMKEVLTKYIKWCLTK